jgi:hypothetical protein
MAFDFFFFFFLFGFLSIDFQLERGSMSIHDSRNDKRQELRLDNQCSASRSSQNLFRIFQLILTNKQFRKTLPEIEKNLESFFFNGLCLGFWSSH